MGKQKRRQGAQPQALRVMAEYASSGIWRMAPRGVFRHGMVEHGALGLPPELAKRFTAWIALYEAQLSEKIDAKAFNETGRGLARELKALFGPGTYVEFVPETAEGGLGLAEVCAEGGPGGH